MDPLKMHVLRGKTGIEQTGEASSRSLEELAQGRKDSRKRDPVQGWNERPGAQVRSSVALPGFVAEQA